MPRLVVLSEGLTGRTHELKAERTTVGRVEDNTFQVPDPSVSSHHCEILLKGGEVLVRDLGSTNGSYINGQQITEAVLKPRQILRLGQVEIRLEPDAPPGGPKKPVFDHTQVVPQGIKLNELDQTVRVVQTTAAFEKKRNKGGKIFLIAALAVATGIVVWLVLLLMDVV